MDGGRKQSVPLIVRSRACTAEPATPSCGVPIASVGTTYTMAQEATWIDCCHFAVGRWDGSLSIFEFTRASSSGPIIAKAVSSPEREGIQMITSMDARSFLSSNDARSAVLWRSTRADWRDLHEASRLEFDERMGDANSGSVVGTGAGTFLALGHANGWITLWQQSDDQQGWGRIGAVDLRSPTPANPWGIHNIRGIAALACDQDGIGYVVSGSEDGNLTVVRVPDGAVMSAQRYNPAAQRGINSLAIRGELLLVANCAVGSKDSNLWAYEMDRSNWRFRCVGNAKLAVAAAPQVFNFDVTWVAEDDERFFCSTEEGALWTGRFSSSLGLRVDGYKLIGGPALGAAVCVQGRALVAVTYDLHEFLIA